ncbi:MAG: YfjI family protein [Planctomycetes bacterium]|nr:YfjI family protein [Planctomycetota bacterium]
MILPPHRNGSPAGFAKTIDENDRLRSGRLPLGNPDEGCELVSANHGPPSHREVATRPLPPFPGEVLPMAMRELITAFAAGVAAPIELAALPAMATLGAALGPRWRCGTQGLAGSPALWFVAVAPSGSSKTPAARPILAPLYEADLRLREEHEHELAAWEARERERKAKRTGDDPGRRPARRRVVITDVTPEALIGELAAAQGHGVLLASDEVAQLLASMDGYRARGRSGRATWLSLWSGTPVKSVRKVSDSCEVDAPFIAVHGGVQPTVLRQLELADGDGLCARFLWSIVPSRPGGLGDGVEQNTRDLWGRAVRLAMEHTVDSHQSFAQEARNFLDERLRRWREQAMEYEESSMGLLASFYGKAGEYLVRLSSLMHGLDAVADLLHERALDRLITRPVPAATVERAARLTDYFLAHGSAAVRLVTSRAARETEATSTDDERLAQALVLILGGEARLSDTPAGWLRRLRKVGHDLGSEDRVGKRFRRLEHHGEEVGLRVGRAPRGKTRSWEVSRSSSESAT